MEHLKGWFSSQVISLTAIGAGFGVLLTIITSYVKDATFDRRKTKREVFHEYSTRYGELVAALIKRGDFDRPFPEDSGEERELSLKLFFLFAEEFYLNEQKLVETETWKRWKTSTEVLMKKQYFIGSWKYLDERYNFSPTFRDWINDSLPQQSNLAPFPKKVA